jgi:hypothetical protein
MLFLITATRRLLHTCSPLVGTGDKDLPLRLLLCKYQRDSTSERIRPVVMSCKRVMDQLLHELRIILVPGIEELKLTVGVVRLDRLDAGELRRGVPDEFVRDSDPGSTLPFAQHELEAAGVGI